MELILSLIIGLLLIFVISCFFVIWNLNRKNEIYEGWVSNFKARADNTWHQMKELDQRQMFESDDEVGIIFVEIRNLIQELDEKLGENLEDDSDES